MPDMDPSLVLYGATFEDFDGLSDNFTNYGALNYSGNDNFVCPDSLEEKSWETEMTFQKIFLSFVYSLVFLVGIMGNGLVLLVLLRHHPLRSTTDNLLLHLAVADLLVLFTFPFSAIESVFGWIFGDFMCKTVGLLSCLNFFCSSLLLGCISVDRYLAIIHAIHSFRTRSGMAVYLPCFGVWVLCFLLSIPNVAFLGTQTNSNLTECTYLHNHFPSNRWWQANRFLIHIVGFLCPLFLMGFCYTHIIAALYKSTRKEKKRAVRVAIVITGVFFLCWTPYHVVLLLDTLEQLGLVKNCMIWKQLPIAILVTEFLGSMHCCLNPVLYAFVGVKFRNDAVRVLQNAGCLSPRLLGITNVPDRKSSIMDSETGTVMSGL